MTPDLLAQLDAEVLACLQLLKQLDFPLEAAKHPENYGSRRRCS